MSFREQRRVKRWALAATTMVWLCGCAQQKPPPPFVAPQVSQSVSYRAGSVLAGLAPATQPISTDPASATEVTVKFVAMESSPAHSLAPATSRARLIVQTESGLPILSAPRLTGGVLWLSATDTAVIAANRGTAHPHRTALISEIHDILPRGVSEDFELADPTLTRDPLSGETVRRRIRLTLHRTDATDASKPSIEVAVNLDDLASSGQAASSSPVFQRETLVLQPVDCEAETHFGIVAPFRLSTSPGWGVAALIDLKPGADDPRQREQLAQVARQLGQTRNPTALPTTLPTDEGPALQAAFDELRRGNDARRTMTFLSDQTGAKLCLEVVLSADTLVLQQLRERILNASPQPAMERSAVGWAMDYQTLVLLTELTRAGKLPPELASVLTLYAGEAGRHESSMDEILRGLTTRSDLQGRLIAENLIFLEDSSPPSRVRAFDWLSACGKAPAGYDPLGPARQRREALDKALSGGAP